VLLLFAWLAISFGLSVHALSGPPQQQVAALEQALFTMTYERDDLNTRLGRMEQSTFGQPTPQLSSDERIQRLSNVILKAPPQKDSPEAMTPLQEQATPATPPPAASPSALANTQVTELEKYLLNKTFPKEPMVKRIERLERQVFKRTQSGSIAGRVGHLNQMVMGNPNTPAPQAASAPTTYPDPDDYAAQPTNGPIAYNDPSAYNGPPMQDPYNAPPPQYQQTQPPTQNGYPVYPVFNPKPYVNNTPSAAVNTSPGPVLDQMEKQVFKQSYSAEATTARLDRLESKIFGSTASDLSEAERIDRLMAVVAADGDNPKAASRKSGWQALLPFVIMIPLLLL